MIPPIGGRSQIRLNPGPRENSGDQADILAEVTLVCWLFSIAPACTKLGLEKKTGGGVHWGAGQSNNNLSS